MTEQPTALWLADRLESRWALHPEMHEAAAELRRLSAVEAQRDALLEALRDIVFNDPYRRSSAGVMARAVIKSVEGEKT